ncbi:phospholipase D-like domain-containing protein [Nocardioides sp. HM23]|uniref:phospholipase D-like domain-containing protein n=1 Tax=Nocardioides bizhenqiangii TaxID=3095076 RepID=UPI002ACA5A17|nr:phospholipase D-like domain-containing protein [Nocardioides sp. HM23]MDZ5622580.1 phospholipase D-like domain-containing protein [Nocardioides sp. HM23]
MISSETHRSLLVAVLVPLVVGAAFHATSPDRSDPDLPARFAAEQAASEAFSPPRRAILANDPRSRPHAIARALARYVDAVPTGEFIKVETYFLGSRITYPALVRAFRRGVHVQVILNGSSRYRFPQGLRLATVLNADRTDRSWVVFTDLSARGPEGVLSINHNKIWRFSRVGDRRWVTVVGSYNNTDYSDTHAFSMMWSLALPPVYDAIEQTFQESRRDRPAGANPMREFRGNGWSSYALPSSIQSADHDPVMKALRSIPARRDTVVRIAMFTMWDSRGEWIADRLAAMARRGARVTFVAGPLVGRLPRAELLAAGVRVEGGCWPADETFVHDKAMSATYVARGERRYWTWIGSDNWTTHTMNSDQTVVGIAGRDVHRQYVRHFDVLTERPDIDPDRCDLFAD